MKGILEGCVLKIIGKSEIYGYEIAARFYGCKGENNVSAAAVAGKKESKESVENIFEEEVIKKT